MSVYTVPENLTLDARAKAIVNEVLDELERAITLYPLYPSDVVHAAAIVSEEAGELVRAANNVYYADSVGNREDLHREAVQTAAMAVRFLMEIGNLKSWEGLNNG
jgi:hypothetical protein